MQYPFLTPDEENRIKYWSRLNRTSAIGLFIAGAFCLAAISAFTWIIHGAVSWGNNKVADFLPIFMFALPAIILLFMGIRLIQKHKRTDAALQSGQKITVKGTLEQVTLKSNYLHYKIDGQSFAVTVLPGADKAYSHALSGNLTAVETLRHTAVTLHLLPVQGQEYLLLGADYAGISRCSEIVQPLTPGDTVKISRNMKLFFFFSIGIFSLFCLVIFWTGGPLVTMLPAALLLLVAVIAMIAFRYRLSAYKEKIVLTGIVTEVIMARERYAKTPPKDICWYRIGGELVCGKPDALRFLPGQRLEAVYFYNNGKRGRLINLTAL